MMGHSPSLQSRRRTGLRYTILLFVVFALIAGWIGFWKFAAGKAQDMIETAAREGSVQDLGERADSFARARSPDPRH